MSISLNTTTLLHILVPLGAVIALILGALAWARISAELLPLPQWVPAIATILSPVTVATLIAKRILLQQTASNNNNRAPNGPWRGVFSVFNQLHSIITTVVATVALAYLFPDSILSCHLNNQWQSYFQTKDAQHIRAIQDRYQCCGFRSIHDRAWPFKGGDVKDDKECERRLGYQQSCYGPWRAQQQNTSWMVFAAALFVLAVKFGFVQLSRRQTSWMSSQAPNGRAQYERIEQSGGGEESDDEGGIDRDARRTILPQSNTQYQNNWDVD